MIAIAAEVIAGLAGLMLAILSVDVVSAMPRRGAWGAYAMWGLIGGAGVSVLVVWRELPLPVAILLLVLTCLVWTRRSRLVWAAEKGKPW